MTSQPEARTPSERESSNGSANSRDSDNNDASVDSHLNGGSGYHPDPARTDDKPLHVRIEVRVVEGLEGKRLRAQQAAAMRDALRWFSEHRAP